MQSFKSLLLALCAAGVAWSAAIPEAAPEVTEAKIIAYVDSAPGGVIPEEYTKLEKRDGTPFLLVCKNANYNTCIIIEAARNGCTVIPSDYDNQISSTTVSDNAFCALYRNRTCNPNSNGSQVLGIGYNLPHTYPNLLAQNYNDDISSIYCTS